MPALNYQSRFAPLVESGQKRQTIRAMRKRPFVVDDTLYHYTGMRTKACRKLREDKCTGVWRIRIEPDGGMCIEGWKCNPFQRYELAQRDGFRSAGNMVLWFQKTHGLPFEGQLIRW